MLNLNKIEQEIVPVLEKYEIAKHSLKFYPGKDARLELCIAKADGSMDLDCCELVANEVSTILDAVDTSSDAYALDVCSFGAESEIESKEEMIASIGQYVYVELTNPKAGLDRVEGILASIEDGVVKINYLDKNIKKTAMIDEDNIKFIRHSVKL